MIARIGDTEDFWLADLAALDAPQNRQEAMEGMVEALGATESLLAAPQAYQVPETGKRLNHPSAPLPGPGNLWSIPKEQGRDPE